MQTESRIPVRYAETDQMGVVHHSHYPVFFEQGRSDFFEEYLQPYSQFEAQGLRAPVLSYQVEILGRARYGDVLRVVTRADWLKGLRVQMSYRVEREQALVAQGWSLHALVGADMKPIHPRGHFAHLYAQLQKVFPAQHVQPSR